MDKIVSIIAGLGVPGLILLVAISATGYVGAAALTSALSALGGSLGMLGGIALLGVLVLISKGLAEYGFDKIFEAVLKELINKGETKETLKKKINKYPISKVLKLKLRVLLEVQSN